MPSRRHALRALAGGAAALGATFAGARLPSPPVGKPAPKLNRIQKENRLPGSSDWTIGGDFLAADDIGMQVKGYASTTSAVLGETVDFRVTVAGGPSDTYKIELYRLGYYGGHRARLVASSPTVAGVVQSEPVTDPATGMITCPWSKSWSWKVPQDATPGLYLTVFSTESGYRNYAPFVVRDQYRNRGLCVVLPFTTYQAYNQFPLDGKTGKSLYYGYDPSGNRLAAERATQVSYDRPYGQQGLPSGFVDDHSFISWAERSGYDINYATSVDIEAGTLPTQKYYGFIFSGHDEYWSPTMRNWVISTLNADVSLAFLGANNIYWPIDFRPSQAGTPNRQFHCQKTNPITGQESMRWRDPAPAPSKPEQMLLGVQYLGVVATPVPLIVNNASHWVWSGASVRNGDKITNVVGGEADGIDTPYALPTNVNQVLLSASPYVDQANRKHTQSTSVYETRNGTIMFVAGSLYWTKALSLSGYADKRIMRATKNVLDRMISRQALAPYSAG